MTDTTGRKQIAEAFKAAKAMLWDGDMVGRHEFICHALKYSGHKGRHKAIKVIHSRLNGEETVVGWLYYFGGVRAESNFTDANLQAYRHRWLDALIEEFSHA